MARILVIRLGALGDFVQSFAPFAAIRAHHAHDEVDLLTRRPFAGLGNTRHGSIMCGSIPGHAGMTCPP